MAIENGGWLRKEPTVEMGNWFLVAGGVLLPKYWFTQISALFISALSWFNTQTLLVWGRGKALTICAGWVLLMCTSIVQLRRMGDNEIQAELEDLVQRLCKLLLKWNWMEWPCLVLGVHRGNSTLSCSWATSQSDAPAVQRALIHCSGP